MPGTMRRAGDGSIPGYDDPFDFHGAPPSDPHGTTSGDRSNLLSMFVSVLAFGLAFVALIVAVTNRRVPAVTTGVRASATAGATLGAGGHGSFTAAQIDAVAGGTVSVQLGDFWVAVPKSAVRAGVVTFTAQNVGLVPHALAIQRAPISFDSPGNPSARGLLGRTDVMSRGRGGRISVRLTPGTYVLFCPLQGDYAAGQRLDLTVTG